MRWLITWWHTRQRTIDCQILWPSLVLRAGSLEGAKTAFMMHALGDAAWLSRYQGGELWAKIDTFTAEEARP